MNAIRQPEGQPQGPGDPDGATLAAIVAAVEVAWPRPVVVVDAGGNQPSPWRFSNRWWTPRRSPASTRVRP